MKINLPSEPYVVVTGKDALEFLRKNWDAYKFDLLELLEFGFDHGITANEILETFANENHDDIVAELGMSEGSQEDAAPTARLIPSIINQFFMEK